MNPYKIANTIPHRAEGRHRRDTLIRASVVLDSTRQRTLADSVMSMVQSELEGNCHIADTDSFLDSIFPLPKKCVEDVYQKIEADGIYSLGSWKGLPKDEKLECGLYVPFANVANAINKACTTNGLQMQVETYWLDRHSTSPQSRSENAAAIRPDILSVLGKAEALESWDKELTKLKESIGGGPGSKESKDIQKKVCVVACHLCLPLSCIASPEKKTRRHVTDMVAPCTCSC